jgi:lipoprotein-releasing system permease protein
VYKALLCWRYLRTRFLAMVCIISVMLGVATLIVVNSVMAGFSTKLRQRLHGLLSDVVLESYDFTGFPDPYGKIAAIEADPFLYERIEAMTPTLECFAMINYRIGGTPVMRPIKLVGIDPAGRARVGGFTEYLCNPDNRRHPSFDLTPEAHERFLQKHWSFRQIDMEALQPGLVETGPFPLVNPQGLQKPAPQPVHDKDPPPMPIGIYVGWAQAHVREQTKDGSTEEYCILPIGDDVQLMTVKEPLLVPEKQRFVIADHFKTEMSEYDSTYVFMTLKDMQNFRNMPDRATSIQIRLKNYDRDAKDVVKHLNELFRPKKGVRGYAGGENVKELSSEDLPEKNLEFVVQTWEEKQGPLLAAISVEKGILNVLLFMIVGVAGFGILAIFSMIVVEKTRDIGILKALGASNFGILNIFLGYGLLLGVVGAALGTALGITITVNINAIERGLSRLTGSSVFPREVYYFKDIPTDIQPMAVTLVNLGAVAIAVLFSILPALRAAMLHPVRALRYE